MVRQEKIINDLKTFQTTVLEDIFKKVEKCDRSVVTELLSKLPTKKQYSKEEKANPLEIYCSYIDH